MQNNKNTWYWIPVLNFASGLPYSIIISVSVLMYKSLGIRNEDIGVYTSLLYLPWVIKPLWSPFIDLHSTKRKWFLSMQLLISIAFLIVGFTIPMSQFFFLSLAIFWVAAFASASILIGLRLSITSIASIVVLRCTPKINLQACACIFCSFFRLGVTFICIRN